MAYEICDGRILTWSLETHVVDHCNLRCRHCCTLSPRLAPWTADAEALRADLRAAATALRPQVFKLTGGEPLLHPRLGDVLDAVRDAGFGAPVSLTTNGHLLPRVDDGVLARLDRMTLSWYPSAPLSAGSLREARRRCERLGILLTVKRCEEFQRMDVAAPSDAAAARATFAACWLRHRCHMIARGRFYACTRPPHLGQAWGDEPLAENLEARDGVDLGAGDLAATILRYLERAEPLASCRLCLGGGGALEPHAQG